MPRTRNPDVDKAQRLYRVDGRTLKEIADKLGYPEGTVRYWKSHYKWDSPDPVKKNEANVGNEKPEKEEKKANVGKRGRPKKGQEKPKQEKPKRHRGGQPGNMNTVGHKSSVPKGNTNALKHGAYSLAAWGVLDDEETEFLNQVPDDIEDQMMQDIQLYTVRERRIMKAINEAAAAKGGLYLNGTMQSEDKRRFKDDEERQMYDDEIQKRVDSGDRLPGESYRVTTTTSSSKDLIVRLERELSTVQRSRVAAEQALAQYRQAKAEAEGSDAKSDVVKAWTEAVQKAREGSEE